MFGIFFEYLRWTGTKMNTKRLVSWRYVTIMINYDHIHMQYMYIQYMHKPDIYIDIHIYTYICMYLQCIIYIYIYLFTYVDVCLFAFLKQDEFSLQKSTDVHSNNLVLH